MKIISLEQGSQEWLDFRRKCITATDASVILGCNPYKNINELIAEKVNGLTTHVNERMQRGKDLEPLALRAFGDITDGIYFPAVVVHDDYTWCMASLDGLEIDGGSIVEIKCPGKSTHTMAKKGKIHDYYYAQIQHQLACTELEFSYYFSYDGVENHLLKIDRDNEYIRDMLEKEFEFYKEHIEGLVF